MKILTVIGARPQFIKAAAVSRLVRGTQGFSEVLVHTGQHYDSNMSDVFFDELEIPKPDYHLEIGSGSHGAMTGRMLEAIETVLMKEKPDTVLVYGDTNSTLAGALSAAKLHIPVAHVEAGLRSFNKKMPEELNRILTDHVSEWLFCPTETAVSNLKLEGIKGNKVHRVGDVMFDASLYFAERAQQKSTVLKSIGLEQGKYILSTIHRAENTDDPDRLKAIMEGLGQIAKECPVVLPLHPRTRATLARLAIQPSPQILMTDPVGYLDMIQLERNARVIATDSGGVQKEAFFFRVPCVTLREETEWVELVELGWNRLVPPTSPALIAEALRSAKAPSQTTPTEIYGAGKASSEIIRILGSLKG